MTDSRETEIILIDFSPTFIFLALQTIFYLQYRLSTLPPKEEDQESIIDLLNEETKDDKFLTVGYYVQYKIIIVLSLLYLFEVPYVLFLASSTFWIDKNDVLLYLYIMPAFAWLLSLKLIKTEHRLYSINLQILWVLTFISNILALVLMRKEEILVVLILRISFSFILAFYALIKDDEDKNKRGKVPKKWIFQVVEQIISKFEENFYVRVIFLGRDYERFLRKEIELSDIDAHSQMNINLSFSDMKKKEKAFVKKLTEKNYLNELEEQEFLSYLPSVQVLIYKEPAKKLPNVIKNYDPRLFFVVHSYLTWDLDNRMEFKIFRKLSEFLELEKKLNEFYLERPFFNRPQVEFQRFSLEDCESNEELLYKKRALTLERFFNFVLLKEKHLIHPLILDFMEISAEEKKPFQAYYNFLIKQKIVRSTRRQSSKRRRGTNATIESPLLTENMEEDFISQSSCSIPLIPMNYLQFEVRLISIWKYPNEPLESNITLGITEKSINYDWEITRKFMDFINLHNALKSKPFKEEPDYQTNSQKITPLLQVKANTLNYFFNFEVIKKDLMDYLSFLVTNSPYHCTELFNFIEFDPNAMKRFVLGRNLNKFLIPTQTVRTFTNESHLGIRQQCSVLSYADYQNTGSKAFITQNTNNNFGNVAPSFARINTNFNNNSRGIPSYKRSNTNQQTIMNPLKFDTPYASDRNSVQLKLQNFFANVTEMKKNGENDVSVVITLNEYMEDKITKVKRRVIFEKKKDEIRQLFDSVIRFCEANGIEMSVPLRNIAILDEPSEERLKNGFEIYLNEVIKIPSISKLKEVLVFFFFDRIKMHFQDSDQKMMVLDLRTK